MKTHKQFDKLAEQCYVKTGSVQTDHFDYVKFAELIVRECADVLDKQIAPPNHPMNSLGYKLKQHFGVKE